MEAAVKRRGYDRAGRRRESQRTRQRIIDAARELVVQRGYRATTVAAVAQKAGVHLDTVYALVGRKPVILRELIEQALSGSDQAVAAEDRAYVASIRAEPEPARKLGIYARAMREIQPRLAPLFLALREAAASELEAQQIWHEIAERRAANMRLLARDLQAVGGLRSGLTVDEAADTIWVTNSPELYVLLTQERGWPLERYERWLAEVWRLLLLPTGQVSGSGA